jgi:hypothetical protein
MGEDEVNETAQQVGKKRQKVAGSLRVETTNFVKGHRNTVTSVALTSDDKSVASGSKDGSVLLCTH